MAKKTVLGNLEVVIGSNTAAFNRGMRESQRDLKRTATEGNVMGRSLVGVFGRVARAATSMRTAIIAGVAAFGAYKFVAGLNAAAKEVDQLGKMSSRLGIGVQQLSALKFAAGEAGIEFEGLSKLFSRFQKTLGDVMGKGGSSISVGRFTVQLKDARGQLKPTTELLGEVGKALLKINNQAHRSSVAQSLFGSDGGDKFLQILGEGGNLLDYLNKSWDRASRLNLLITPEQAKTMAAYNDSLGRVTQAYQGMRVQIMTGLAPALTVLNNKMAEMIADAPRLARAVGRALGAASGGDPQQRAIAAGAMTDVRLAGIDLIKTLAVEGGRVLGMTFVETITLGLRAAAPTLGDVFRDSIGQALNGVLGVSIDPSARGKLKDLRRRLELAEDPVTVRRIAGAQRELAALDAAPSGDKYDMFARSASRSRIKAFIQDLGGVPDELREAIALQEEIIRRQDIERAEALGEAFADWLTILDAAESSLTNKIVPKFQEFEKARDIPRFQI